MSGSWRLGYVLTAVAALFFNVFVLVVQLLLKVPALPALAPKQDEPPFAIAQAVGLVAFVVAGVFAVRRFPRRAKTPKPCGLRGQPGR
jgi:hypothetical protein